MANMIHVKPKGSWKKVKIDPAVFPKADLEGLISLEELTDYEIVKNSAESANKTSGKVRKLIKSHSLALQVIVFHKSFAIFYIFLLHSVSVGSESVRTGTTYSQLTKVDWLALVQHLLLHFSGLGLALCL